MTLNKTLYPHCLVLVGSRNGIKHDFVLKCNNAVIIVMSCDDLECSMILLECSTSQNVVIIDVL